MQRLRVEYSRGEPVQYLSHLDMIRLFERAIQRAEIPIAYSEGFNPHPKLAFGPPLAVGLLSDQEFLDITLGQTMDPEQLCRQLGRQMPGGIVLKGAAAVPDGVPALMAVIERATYHVRVPVAGERLDAQIRSFLEQTEIRVRREGKKGPEDREIRSGIHKLTGGVVPEGIELRMEVRNDNDGSVRPDEVVGAFLTFVGMPVGGGATVRRTGLLARRGNELVSPLELF